MRTQYPSDNNQVELYGPHHGLTNEFRVRPGVCVLPLAEDPPETDAELATYSPVAVLRLHAPYRERIANYIAEKTNNPPMLPPPENTGSFVFTGGDLTFANRLNATGRNFDWSIGCRYTFVENCVSRTEDGFVLGLLPYSWLTSEVNATEGYVTPAPGGGAVAAAGKDALVGFKQGLFAIADSQGHLKTPWGYNTSSYFPGTFFYSDLLNAGPPVNPPTIPGG